MALLPGLASGDAAWASGGRQPPGGAETVTDGEVKTVREGPRELLELAGIDASHFRMIRDNEPLVVDEREVLLKMLYRARKFDLLSIARWTQPKFEWSKLAGEPEKHRAEMFQLTGRVRKVTEAQPPPEVVARYRMDHYYLCEMEVGAALRPAAVITTRIPDAWPVGVELDERASAAGLFFKAGGEAGATRKLVFLAPRVAWHPDHIQHEAPAANLGMTMLGDLGVDVGLLENVENRSEIDGEEREAFYQLLWAVEHAGTAQLVRQGRQNLDRLAKIWRQESDKQTRQIAQLRDEIERRAADGRPTDKLQAQLKRARLDAAILRRSLARAEEGAFSVFPLFNRPDQQRGRLVVLEGNARRAVKIVVGSGNANADIRARYGIDHYYEIELFTSDSEDNPLVFCVRELPPGFPTGEDINEGVRLAGFFFKTWAFHTQGGAEGQGRRRQLAPLLIGRAPVWIQPPPAASGTIYGAIAGGLFVAAALGIWIGLWRLGRGDQEFHRRALAPRRAVAEGESLDKLGIEAEDKPDFSHLD
jgi:hypothetical protein